MTFNFLKGFSRSNLLNETYEYCMDFLETSRCKSLPFHSIEHTRDVFNYVKTIADYEEIFGSDLEPILIAALFHDTGMAEIYVNHEDLKILGIKTVKIELNNSSFDDFIQNLQPEIVVFDRFMMEEQFGWRVSNICPDALKILDTEDLHFLRNFRESAFKNKNLQPALLKESELAKREIASIYRCDLSLIISESEMELLEEQFHIPQNLLLYLPFLLNPITTETLMQLPGFEDRQHFISIGNFRHPPNVDAVFYLKQEIWPFIQKQLPKAQMHIYGAYSTARITQLHLSLI